MYSEAPEIRNLEEDGNPDETGKKEVSNGDREEQLLSMFNCPSVRFRPSMQEIIWEEMKQLRNLSRQAVFEVIYSFSCCTDDAIDYFKKRMNPSKEDLIRLGMTFWEHMPEEIKNTHSPATEPPFDMEQLAWFEDFLERE